jgi:DNA-binding NarL/FixJ family response regulator
MIVTLKEVRRPRVLIADDLPEVHEKVRRLLWDDYEIVGAAYDGEQAIEAATTLNPDILITDISMPILNGIQVASRLRDTDCKAKLIFLTVHEDPDYIEAVFSLGALGYVLKSHFSTDLLPAIGAALRGHRFSSDVPVRSR